MSASMKAFEHFVQTGDTSYIPEKNMDEVHRYVGTRMGEAVARKSGLTASTVDELLSKGWVYEEGLNKPSMWIHPMVSLLDNRFDFR